MEPVFLVFFFFSKSPPAIITGVVREIRNIEIVSFTGLLCFLDVDFDGADETFLVSEARGWRDEWIGGRWVAYEVLLKRIDEIDGNDTIRVASFHFSFRAGQEPPLVFVSAGFLDANGDGSLDIAIAMWDDEGFSRMAIHDLSGLDRGERPEITELLPDLMWASYEIKWPLVRVKSPYGKREYFWKDGGWMEND